MDCLHPAIKSPILCNSDQCIGTQHYNVEQPMKPHEITENGYNGSMESEVREINHDEKIGTLTGTQKGLELEPQAAAVAMQKAYRGYRTRRNLADCAIAAANGYESYGWWNVLEGALLKQSTIYAGPQNAAGRWVRLKKKAAKVGRGLSKDENARKLAFQHWLEAIDPRHRYGHNLHYYYDVWLKSQTQEPFFYWLDVGEGRDVDLEACPRSKLQKEQIMYLGPKERKHYEVVINEDGKLNFKQSGDLVHTPDEDDKWIFVLSPTGKLYVGQKEKGRFQHSSFLAGGAATAAGRLIVKDGVLQLMEAHSGHYRPTEENFRMLIEILKQNGADLKVAKVETVSDEMRRSRKSGSLKKAGSLKKTGSLKKSVSLKKKNSELSEAIKVEEVSMLTTTISGNDMEVKLDVHQDGVTSSPEMQSPEMQTLAGNDNQVETLSIDNAPLVIDAAANSTWRALEPENKERIIGQMFSHPLISPRYLPSKPLVGKPTLRKIESLKWSSGTGPRLSSLGNVPSDIRSRAWEALQSPRPKLPKTPPAFTMPTLIMQSN